MNPHHDDLMDISERLRTQDNRCTTDPMFCLQIKVRDWGYAPQYGGDDTVWIDMESGDYEEVEPETEGAEEFGFKDRWETVMVAFTEQGIEDYMRQDGHNVKRRAHNGETRIYVESFRRCDEMIRIRECLINNVPVRTYARPSTRGELKKMLHDGIPCEVASFVAEMTDIMLRGWLEKFDSFSVRPSENNGWSVFEPTIIKDGGEK
jgi:hypothetical protein